MTREKPPIFHLLEKSPQKVADYVEETYYLFQSHQALANATGDWSLVPESKRLVNKIARRYVTLYEKKLIDFDWLQHLLEDNFGFDPVVHYGLLHDPDFDITSKFE